MNPRFLIFPALVLLPLAVFAQTARFPFIDYDDGDYVYANPHVVGGLTAENVRWAFTTTRGGKWMPLTWLSFMLDAEFAGRPAPVSSPRDAGYAGVFHLTNVFFHTANGLLLFAALRAMTGSWWASGLAAALFAVHPLRVESVAWVTERKDVLSMFFGLLALWGYARYAHAPGAGRYAVVCGCFALGLMAKEMIVTLPFLLLLLDYWPLRRFPASRRREPARDPQAPGDREPVAGQPRAYAPRWLVIEKLPLLALSIASSAAGFFAHRVGGAVASLDAIPLPVRLTNAVWSCTSYLAKTVWPFRLAVYYPHPGATLSTGLIAASTLLLLLLTVVAVRRARRAPWAFVGWFWFLGTLVPMIGIVQVGTQGMADRFTYFPQIGLFVAAAWTAAAAGTSARRRAALASAGVLLVAALAFVSARQTALWRDGETLFRHALAVTGCNTEAHRKLAAYHRQRGEDGLAIQHLRSAVECEPYNHRAHTNLAVAYAGQRPPWRAGALHHFHAAVRLDPRDAAYRFNLGQFLADDAQLPAAEGELREALRLRDDFPAAWNALGEVLERQDRLDEAADCFREALRRDPQYRPTRRNLDRLVFPSSSGVGKFSRKSGQFSKNP